MALLAPMLSVRGGKAALAFYAAAFGAEAVIHAEDGDGRVVAELTLGESRFWVADESPENANHAPQSLGGNSSTRFILEVDDPDAVFARAVAAGAEPVWPVADAYGWRLGRVRDPFGHHWEIGRRLTG